MPDITRAFGEEVVFTDSEDRLALHGLFFKPGSTTASLPVLWIHGIYSAFYENAYVALGREMARRGYTFLSANTRGHGFGAALRSPDGRPVTGGSGWERLEESPRDHGAWVDFLVAVRTSRPRISALKDHRFVVGPAAEAAEASAVKASSAATTEIAMRRIETPPGTRPSGSVSPVARRGRGGRCWDRASQPPVWAHLEPDLDASPEANGPFAPPASVPGRRSEHGFVLSCAAEGRLAQLVRAHA